MTVEQLQTELNKALAEIETLKFRLAAALAELERLRTAMVGQ